MATNGSGRNEDDDDDQFWGIKCGDAECIDFSEESFDEGYLDVEAQELDEMAKEMEAETGVVSEIEAKILELPRDLRILIRNTAYVARRLNEADVRPQPTQNPAPSSDGEGGSGGCPPGMIYSDGACWPAPPPGGMP